MRCAVVEGFGTIFIGQVTHAEIKVHGLIFALHLNEKANASSKRGKGCPLETPTSQYMPANLLISRYQQFLCRLRLCHDPFSWNHLRYSNGPQVIRSTWPVRLHFSVIPAVLPATYTSSLILTAVFLSPKGTPVVFTSIARCAILSFFSSFSVIL